jgi:hypothetical protein
MIINALLGEPLPVYGRGENVRDWLFVDDHAQALLRVLEDGTPGETYCIGGRSEMRNIDVVTMICDLVDELAPDAAIGSRRDLIRYVTDRPGHDLRYAIDCTRISTELGWNPARASRGAAADGAVVPGEPRLVGAGALRRVPRRAPRPLGRGWAHEGDHPRRRKRHAALPDHPDGQQAAAAGVRQADDLLPAQHADAGGDPGDPDHLDTRTTCRASGSCSATASGGGCRSRTRSSRGRRGWRRRSSSGATSSGRPCLPDPRRQHLLRTRADGAAAAGGRAGRGRDRLRLLRGRPGALRRGGVRERRSGREHRGEAGAAEDPTTR